MKKITLSLGIMLINIMLINNLLAQNERCGTTEELNRIFAENPAIKEACLKRESELEALDKVAFANGYKNESRAAAPVYTIPVVFHIIHEGGSENISDAQIMDGMRILNEDYRKQNSDISQVVSAFVPLAADCEIEFKLAQKTPTGAWTNGIDRIYSSLTTDAHNNAKLNPWPYNKYLNVWVVKSIRNSGSGVILGFATSPGSATTYDGVMLLHNRVGSIGTAVENHPTTLTHEVGHWLSLRHVWGNSDVETQCGDDGVSDTPLTEGHQSCPLTSATCTSGVTENVQNFMEYSSCRLMFTEGQKTRMRNVLTNSTGGRNNLWTTANLSATGVSLPATLAYADFTTTNEDHIVCQGSPITFINTSWNGTPTSYNWIFPGGVPASSTLASPSVTYNESGNYEVSLTVSNATGTVSTTKTNFVKVYPSSAIINASAYVETFENSSIPNNNWQVNNNNSGSNTWTQTTAAAYSGSKCVSITNLSTADGHIDELISPSIDMTKIGYEVPYYTYKVAYAQRVATNADKVQVLVSTDCGKTWTIRHTLTGAALSTTGTLVTGSFVPTSKQWKNVNVNLGSYKTYTNLFVMLRFTSNGGNNIYIDDINIGTMSVGNEIVNDINLNIYPNPIDNNGDAIVSFELLNEQKIDIALYDVYGRKINAVFAGNLNTGAHKFSIGDVEKLSAGIYFVKVSVDENTVTKKLIVQ